MCGLCGVLAGADHWSDTAAAPQGSTPSQLRQIRTRLANRVLAHHGLKLTDAPGGLVLRSATGQSAVVAHLGALWTAAERIGGKPLDPLDPELIAALSQADM
jgi:hypothetical protein